MLYILFLSFPGLSIFYVCYALVSLYVTFTIFLVVIFFFILLFLEKTLFAYSLQFLHFLTIIIIYVKCIYKKLYFFWIKYLLEQISIELDKKHPNTFIPMTRENFDWYNNHKTKIRVSFTKTMVKDNGFLKTFVVYYCLSTINEMKI